MHFTHELTVFFMPKADPLGCLDRTLLSDSFACAVIRLVVTSFVFNFDISSTIEISLLAVVMTFSQGIVLFSLYALHPRMLKYCEAALNWIASCWQPSNEATRFVSVDAQEEVILRNERSSRLRQASRLVVV